MSNRRIEKIVGDHATRYVAEMSVEFSVTLAWKGLVTFDDFGQWLPSV